MVEYESIKQTANRWNISIRRIQILCKEDRVPGAFRVGNAWAIPKNATKPRDKRIKSGNYVKSN